jgi:hypothetical protein
MTLPQLTSLTSVRPGEFALPPKIDAEGSVFVGVVGAEGAVDWKVGKLAGAAASTNPSALPTAVHDKRVDSSSPIALAEEESERPSRWVKY